MNSEVENLDNEKFAHISAVCDLESTDKSSAIREILENADVFKDIEDIESLKQSVLSRERVISTGLGRGVAIAHGESSELLNVTIAIGVSKDGIEYGALDGQLVHILFLIINAKSDSSEYLEILSSITKVMRNEDVRGEICRCSSKAEIEAKFLHAVDNL